MQTADYVFTGVDIDANGEPDFGIATISNDGKTMTVTDTVADLGIYTYSITWKNSQTGQTGMFDPGIKNRD